MRGLPLNPVTRAGRYCWMRARFADFTHLARDMTMHTLCGIPLDGPVPIREIGNLSRVCPHCAELA
jgi:hypothetical protein